MNNARDSITSIFLIDKIVQRDGSSERAAIRMVTVLVSGCIEGRRYVIVSVIRDM